MNTGKTYKTRQRAEIEGVLRDGDCMTVRDICARLASSGANVGETTVYRTLEKLDCGFIRRMEAHIEKEHGFTLDSGRTVLYGLCGRCGKERAQ